HDRVLDRCRPAHVDDRIERGPGGATGEEHVIDQHDAGTVDVEVDLGALHHGLQRDLGEVVPVQRDVQLADHGPRALEPFDERGQTLRQGGAARVYADQGYVAGALVALDHLVGDPPHG